MTHANLKGLEFSLTDIPAFSASEIGRLILHFQRKDSFPRFHLKVELLTEKKEKIELQDVNPITLEESSPKTEYVFNIKNLPRGLYQLDQIRIKSPYPFAWFTAIKNFKQSRPFFVYPAAKSFLPEFDPLQNLGSEDFYEHQNYRGENSRVDWKLWARRQILMQKLYHEENVPRSRLQWSGLHSLEFEDKLSQITYWLIQNHNKLPLELVLPQKSFQISQDQDMQEVLKYLATLKEGEV